MGNVIVGTRQFRVVILGEMPPGMTQEELNMWVSSGITVSMNLASKVRSMDVGIVGGGAAPEDGGLALPMQ